MNYLFQQRFFRLLSECLQHQVPASELIKAIEELATHIADFSINEQDYNILLRYFSFGLYRLKSYRVRFEQEKKMPHLHLIDEAIGLLNTEIRLIEWRNQIPGTATATYPTNSPFPSLSSQTRQPLSTSWKW